MIPVVQSFLQNGHASFVGVVERLCNNNHFRPIYKELHTRPIYKAQNVYTPNGLSYGMLDKKN